MSYHESSAKKIHYTKIDPSLGFAFLLKRESDFDRLKDFMLLGKRVHNKNWIFHSMPTKPDFMKSSPRKDPKQKKKKNKRKPKSSFEDISGFENLDEN